MNQPGCSSQGGHVFQKLRWWWRGFVNFPIRLTHRQNNTEKARFCAHLPGFSSESIYTQMQ